MVSIIVPVYNVKEFLYRCLDSIKHQKLTDFELLIVDDGSTDGSSQLVDKYATGCNNIKVIHKENGGLMSAWTIGVRASSGEYIGFVDSDDSIDPEMYSKMLSIAKDTGADIVWCDFKDDATNKSSSSPFKNGFYEGNDIDEIKSHIFPIPGQDIVSNARWNKLYRRSIIVDNLKYVECLSRTFEDRYIVPAAVLSTNTFYYLKEALYIYTQDRPGCNSNKYKENLLDEMKRMYYVQERMLKDKGLYEKYGKNWEKSYLNCIRIYVGRNIIGVKGFLKRYKSSYKLLNDPLTKDRMTVYGNLQDASLGKVLRIAYRFHSPLFLTICSYFA